MTSIDRVFFYMTHMVKLTKNLELEYVGDPILYHKNDKILRYTIQDPVSCWKEGEDMYVTANIRDNFSHVYKLDPVTDWNGVTRDKLNDIKINGLSKNGRVQRDRCQDLEVRAEESFSRSSRTPQRIITKPRIYRYRSGNLRYDEVVRTN